MRLLLVAMLAAVSGGPAVAQSAPQPNAAAESSQAPVDLGPNTPAANNAYQGGGVILQGAPGAPPPKVEPTPPGQTPKNIIPPTQ